MCSSFLSSAKGPLESVHLVHNLSDTDTNCLSQRWLSVSKNGESACVWGSGLSCLRYFGHKAIVILSAVF